MSQGADLVVAGRRRLQRVGASHEPVRRFLREAGHAPVRTASAMTLYEPVHDSGAGNRHYRGRKSAVAWCVALCYAPLLCAFALHAGHAG